MINYNSNMDYDQIRLTPINYQISYDAYKEFVDAQGVTQVWKLMTTI